jgi:hypothetical protein
MNPQSGTDGVFDIPFEGDTVMSIRWKCMDMTLEESAVGLSHPSGGTFKQF